MPAAKTPKSVEPTEPEPEAETPEPEKVDATSFKGPLRAFERTLMAGLLVHSPELRDASLTRKEWETALARYRTTPC